MGHKWNQIREKIASSEASASRIYAKFAREIYAAARRREYDPDAHLLLEIVQERAKTYRMPKAMIDHALEKAKGGGEVNYVHVRLAGIGPDGTEVIVEALTNNVSRTASEVNEVFKKNDISLDENGSVNDLYYAMGYIGQTSKSLKEVSELLSKAQVGAYYLDDEVDGVISVCHMEDFHEMLEALKKAGVAEFTLIEQTMEAQDGVTLPADAMASFQEMIDALENLDDVLQVYHNVFSDEDDEAEAEEGHEAPLILSDGDQGVIDSIKRAIEQVISYSYNGSMRMTGQDTDLTMIMEGDINLRPEFALHCTTSLQSGDMDMEQAMVIVHGKVYSKDYASEEWIVSEDPGDLAAPEGLSQYFSSENLQAIQTIRMTTAADEIRMEFLYDAQKFDRIVQKNRTAPKTAAARQQFRIDSTTMLPMQPCWRWSRMMEMKS